MNDVHWEAELGFCLCSSHVFEENVMHICMRWFW